MEKYNLLVTNKAQVRSVFGKSEKDALGDVEILRNWAKTQAHLPEVPGDQLIESMLVNNKYGIEKTKQNLDMYYTLRGLLPEFYEERNPKLPHMRIVSNSSYICPLPTLSKDLYRIIIMKFRDDVEHFDFSRYFAHYLNIMEVRFQEDLALGFIFVIDVEDLKIGHVLKMTPVLIKKSAVILEKLLSNRMQSLHYINYPPYIDKLVFLVKSILNPKLAERIKLHKTIEDNFFEYVPKKILPKDYGGEELSLDELTDLWTKKLEDYQERFDKLDKMRVDEQLRPAPLENSELLGYYGNFKRLNVD